MEIHYNNEPMGCRRTCANGMLFYHLGMGVWVKTTEHMADILDKI